MGFSRQEYRSGLLCSLPGDLPNPGIKPRSPSLQADSLQSEPPGKPKNIGGVVYPFSRGTSQSRNWTEVFCIAGGFFTSWVTQEALGAQILFFLLWSPIPFPSSPYFSSLDSALVSLPLHNILTWASFSFVDLEGCGFLPEELHLWNICPDLNKNLELKKCLYLCYKWKTSLISLFYQKVRSRYWLTQAFNKCLLKWNESLGKCLGRSSESLK